MFELYVVWCLAGTPDLDMNAVTCVRGHTLQPDCIIGYDVLLNILPEGHKDSVVRIMGCWEVGPNLEEHLEKSI